MNRILPIVAAIAAVLLSGCAVRDAWMLNFSPPWNDVRREINSSWRADDLGRTRCVAQAQASITALRAAGWRCGALYVRNSAEYGQPGVHALVWYVDPTDGSEWAFDPQLTMRWPLAKLPARLFPEVLYRGGEGADVSDTVIEAVVLDAKSV